MATIPRSAHQIVIKEIGGPKKVGIGKKPCRHPPIYLVLTFREQISHSLIQKEELQIYRVIHT